MGYKLIYEGIDGFRSEVAFKEEIGLEELTQNLRYFLLSCSWLPKQVDKILGEQK